MYRLNIKIKVNQFKFNRVKFLCFLNVLLELTKQVRKLRYIISGVGWKVWWGVVKHSRCKSLNCFLPLCSLSRCNLTSPSTSQEQFWSTSKQFKLCLFFILQNEDEACRAASPPGPARCPRAEPSPTRELFPGFLLDPPQSQSAGEPQPHLLRGDVWCREHGDTHSCLHLHPERLR